MNGETRASIRSYASGLLRCVNNQNLPIKTERVTYHITRPIIKDCNVAEGPKLDADFTANDAPVKAPLRHWKLGDPRITCCSQESRIGSDKHASWPLVEWWGDLRGCAAKRKVRN